MTTLTIGARFLKAGRMYFFDPAGVTDLVVNDWIIVKTDLGLDAARVQLMSSDSPMMRSTRCSARSSARPPRRTSSRSTSANAWTPTRRSRSPRWRSSAACR